MKKYKCHEVVHAGKIISMKPSMSAVDYVILKIEDHGPIEVDRNHEIWMVDRAYMDKHKPKVGGYFILYEDSYRSFSPAETFENGYTEVK